MIQFGSNKLSNEQLNSIKMGGLDLEGSNVKETLKMRPIDDILARKGMIRKEIEKEKKG